MKRFFPELQDKKKIRRAADIFIAVFLAVYIIIGLIIVPEYGLHTDNIAQRKHSLVTYKYLNKALLGLERLPQIEDLETYDQYYGVALQIPMVLYEDIHHFTLRSDQIHLFRHICCFLLCVSGYLCFYLTLRRLFYESPAVPVLGTMMISLYPRFYAAQFTDIKNMIFAATCMFALYCMVLAVEKKKAGWQILFGCASALAVNTRMMAIIFPVLLLGYYLCADLTRTVQARRGKAAEERSGKKTPAIWKYILVSVSFFLFWLLITPKAWTEGNPFLTFANTFTRFSSYDRWTGKMVFMGHRITCEMVPKYYLFVWFAISIPILYLILAAAGHAAAGIGILRSKNKWQSLLTDHRWFMCAFALFWGSVGAVILLHSRIYVGWHHLYYVFVPLCVMMCFGLERLLRIKKIRLPVIVLLVVYLALLGVWNGEHYLWGTAYFNAPGSLVADQFDRGETQSATLSLCRWILNQEEGEFTVRWKKNSYDALTPEEKKRVTLQSSHADYIIENYRGVVGNDLSYKYKGYEEVHTVWVNGYKVGSVFKRTAGKK